jgi:NAD(P)-dependent dehydrogenase (short-subunit alcohol dehydrogenase family)
MKRFHVHVGVENLDQSIDFYSGLFGAPPTLRKNDYAKWMIEDPRLNFAISERGGRVGINHLGHFALTGLLIDVLERTPGSRVVNISSGGHRMGIMDFDNLLYSSGKGYSRTGAYGRSKLSNLIFTYELERRLEANGHNPIAVAAHPGLSETHLADHFWGGRLKGLTHAFMKLRAQNAAMGALPGIRAAVDPEVKGGQYYGPGGPKERKGYPILVQSNLASHDEGDAQRLWQVSEELTGVKYL